MERVTLPNASTAEIVSGGRPPTRLENRRDSSARRFWKSLIRVVRDTRPTPPIRSLFYKRRDAKKRMSADIQPVQTRSGLSPLPSRPDTLVFWPRSTGRCQGETKPRSIRDTIYARRPRAPPSFSDRSIGSCVHRRSFDRLSIQQFPRHFKTRSLSANRSILFLFIGVYRKNGGRRIQARYRYFDVIR